MALQLLTAFQALFFAGYLLVRRRPSRPANVILATLLAVLAAHIGANLLVDRLLDPSAPAAGAAAGETLGLALLVDGTFGFLYGPLLLGFVRVLTFGRRLGKGDALHLLPFGLAVPVFAWHLVGPDALTVAVFVSLGTYLALSQRALREYRRALAATRSDLQPVRLACLSAAVAGLAVAVGLNVASYLAGRAGHGGWPVLATCLFAVLLAWVSSFVLAALWEPRLFAQIGEPERAAVLPAAPGLTRSDEEDLRRLELLMHERRPYLQAQLTLAELAEIAGLPLRRLSNLVNRGRSQTFSDWVNGYRVEEAKRLLGAADRHGRTILTLLEEAGFNSKSTFNTVFKQKTGFSPRAWRQREAAAVQDPAAAQTGATRQTP